MMDKLIQNFLDRQVQVLRDVNYIQLGDKQDDGSYILHVGTSQVPCSAEQVELPDGETLRQLVWQMPDDDVDRGNIHALMNRLVTLL